MNFDCQIDVDGQCNIDGMTIDSCETTGMNSVLGFASKPTFASKYKEIANVNVNVKSLGLTKSHAMKACGGVGVYLHSFLTAALDGGE
jgi:hypothetical protein